MSLNIENAPAIAAATAVGAVLPLSQRVEERHPDRDASTSPKGLQGLAAGPAQDEGGPHLVLEDISFVERPIRDEAEDQEDVEEVVEADGPRVGTVLVDARAAPAPALLALAGAPTPPSSFPGQAPLDGTFGHMPAGLPLSQAGVPATAAPATPLQTASIPVIPGQQGDGVMPAALHRAAAAGVPVAATPAIDPVTSLPPTAAAVPAPAGEHVQSQPVQSQPSTSQPATLLTGMARPAGPARHEVAAWKATMAAAAANAQAVQRPVEAPAPAEPVARQDAGNVTTGQGDPSSAMTPAATATREAATQQAEQRTGQEAGQARSQENTQIRRHVQYAQHVQETNDRLAARSAAPQISYPFLTWGPGNSAVVQLKPGQLFTVQTSSLAVRHALSATAAPDGLTLQVLEPTAAEPVSATDADPEEKRKKQSERDPS